MSKEISTNKDFKEKLRYLSALRKVFFKVEIFLIIFSISSTILKRFSIEILLKLTRDNPRLFEIKNKTAECFEANIFGIRIKDKPENRSGVSFDFQNNPLKYGAKDWQADLVNASNILGNCFFFFAEVS